MRYNVHLFATARVKVCDVAATSQSDAVSRAQREVDLHNLLNRELNGKDAKDGQVAHIEFADEVTTYLVDVRGDEDFNLSEFFETDGRTRMVDGKTRAERALEMVRDLAKIRIQGEPGVTTPVAVSEQEKANIVRARKIAYGQVPETVSVEEFYNLFPLAGDREMDFEELSLETYGEEIDVVKRIAEKQSDTFPYELWTVCDGEGGDEDFPDDMDGDEPVDIRYVHRGFHYVNRLNYMVVDRRTMSLVEHDTLMTLFAPGAPDDATAPDLSQSPNEGPTP
jgi:hypothetical protein